VAKWHKERNQKFLWTFFFLCVKNVLKFDPRRIINDFIVFDCGSSPFRKGGIWELFSWEIVFPTHEIFIDAESFIGKKELFQ